MFFRKALLFSLGSVAVHVGAVALLFATSGLSRGGVTTPKQQRVKVKLVEVQPIKATPVAEPIVEAPSPPPPTKVKKRRNQRKRRKPKKLITPPPTLLAAPQPPPDPIDLPPNPRLCRQNRCVALSALALVQQFRVVAGRVLRLATRDLASLA